MTFVNTLMIFLSRSMGWLGDAFSKLFNLLAYPFGWIIAICEGVWYFLTKLFEVVVLLLQIFISFFQLLGSLALGFMRTIKSLLFIDFSQTPIHYPSAMGTGLELVVDVLRPVGFLTVVPMVLLAVIWLFFILRVFALIGGEVGSDD